MGSNFRADPEHLGALADANEIAAATHSLDAELTHWQDGRQILARDWIEELYTEVWPTAKQSGFSCFLTPIHQILEHGNEAQQWLKQHQQGQSIQSVMQDAIANMSQTEIDLRNKLCEPVAV